MPRTATGTLKGAILAIVVPMVAVAVGVGEAIHVHRSAPPASGRLAVQLDDNRSRHAPTFPPTATPDPCVQSPNQSGATLTVEPEPKGSVIITVEAIATGCPSLAGTVLQLVNERGRLLPVEGNPMPLSAGSSVTVSWSNWCQGAAVMTEVRVMSGPRVVAATAGRPDCWDAGAASTLG